MSKIENFDGSNVKIVELDSHEGLLKISLCFTSGAGQSIITHIHNDEQINTVFALSKENHLYSFKGEADIATLKDAIGRLKIKYEGENLNPIVPF